MKWNDTLLRPNSKIDNWIELGLKWIKEKKAGQKKERNSCYPINPSSFSLQFPLPCSRKNPNIAIYRDASAWILFTGLLSWIWEWAFWLVSLVNRERFPYFKANDDRWKNSVRHNLSISPHFRKSVKARTGTGHLWTLALPPSARTIAANLAVRTTSANTTNSLQYEFMLQHLRFQFVRNLSVLTDDLMGLCYNSNPLDVTLWSPFLAEFSFAVGRMFRISNIPSIPARKSPKDHQHGQKSWRILKNRWEICENSLLSFTNRER